jgi:hypothetical protein
MRFNQSPRSAQPFLGRRDQFQSAKFYSSTAQISFPAAASLSQAECCATCAQADLAAVCVGATNEKLRNRYCQDKWKSTAVASGLRL